MAKDMSKLQAGRLRFAADTDSTSKRDLLGGCTATGVHLAKIRARCVLAPLKARGAYVRAMTGKSKAAAIKAFCQMCVGWSNRRYITECTDPACPLYPYRPFRPK